MTVRDLQKFDKIILIMSKKMKINPKMKIPTNMKTNSKIKNIADII